MIRQTRLYGFPQRATRVLFLCAGVLAACALPPTPQASRGAGDGAEHPGRCTVREVSRERLVVEGGRQLYVEPVVMEASPNGDVLLAGTYNYLFGQNPRGEWVRVADDSVFGAVLPRGGGPARIVPSPVPSRLLNGVRAVALGESRWAVVFAEVSPWKEGMRPDSAARLWYGVVDSGRWTTLERLPMPAGVTLRPALASSLVKKGDNMAWAMTLDPPGELRRILLYERRGGRWSYEVIPTSHAQVQLAYSDTLGLVLALAQANPALKVDSNSLLFWVRQPTWKPLRVVVPGALEEVYNPSVDLSAPEGVVTWRAAVRRPDGTERWEAHAMVGRVAERNEPVIVLDSAITRLQAINFLALPNGRRLWVTDHTPPSGQEREIRIVTDSARAAAVLMRIPNPYFTPYAAVGIAPSEVLLNGGILDRDQDIGVSLLLRARVECRAGKS